MQIETQAPTRRAFLAGSAAATGALALGGCQSLGGLGGFGLVDAVRELLTLSAQNAFSKLTAPGGFWDSQVARIAVPDLFGNRGGGLIQNVLTSGLFRSQLQRQLNGFAERGAERAAPVVLDTIRAISLADALGLLRGGPSAATQYLRGQMGTALINAMVPGLADAMRVANDPILGQAISALAGVNLGQIAQSVAVEADNSIWAQMGVEEAAIRANPESTRNPALIAALKVL
jgi:hypothetical protein